MKEKQGRDGKIDLAVGSVVRHVPVECLFFLRLHRQTVAVVVVVHVAVIVETILDHLVANGKKVGNRLAVMGKERLHRQILPNLETLSEEAN